MPKKSRLALLTMLSASLLPTACNDPAPLVVRPAQPEPPPQIDPPEALTDPVKCPSWMTDPACLPKSSFFRTS